MAGFDLGAVTATVTANITNFTKGMESVRDQVQGFSSTAGSIAKGVAITGTAIAGVATAGFFAMKKFADVAGEAQAQTIVSETLMQTTAEGSIKVFEKYKKAADETAQAMVNLGFDDEEATSAFARSLSITKDVAQSRKDMALAADFARLKGISLGDSQKAIQKAFEGNAKAVREYGIEIQDGASKQSVFNQIQALSKDQAKAFAASYVGAGEVFAVKLSNLKEQIGSAFLPIMTKVLESLSKVIEYVSTIDFTPLANTISSLIPYLESFVTGIFNVGTQIYNTFMVYIYPILAQFAALWRTNWTQVSTDTTSSVYAVQVMIKSMTDFIQLVFTSTFGWLQTFIVENWSFIQNTFGSTFEAIKALVITVGEFLFVTFSALFVWLSGFIRDHWDTIVFVVKGAITIISSVIKIFAGVITAIFAVLTAFITGDWSLAWTKIQSAMATAWDGIKGLFGTMLSFTLSFGKTILGYLVKPFEDAWHRIEDIVKNIKSALDFTQRHSPSVVDVVKRGVSLVNDSLEGLNYQVKGSVGIDTSSLGQGMATSTSFGGITVNLDGAIISSNQDAQRMSELIGDGIVNKLKQSIRI